MYLEKDLPDVDTNVAIESRWPFIVIVAEKQKRRLPGMDAFINK